MTDTDPHANRVANALKLTGFGLLLAIVSPFVFLLDRSENDFLRALNQADCITQDVTSTSCLVQRTGYVNAKDSHPFTGRADSRNLVHRVYVTLYGGNSPSFLEVSGTAYDDLHKKRPIKLVLFRKHPIEITSVDSGRTYKVLGGDGKSVKQQPSGGWVWLLVLSGGLAATISGIVWLATLRRHRRT